MPGWRGVKKNAGFNFILKKRRSVNQELNKVSPFQEAKLDQEMFQKLKVDMLQNIRPHCASRRANHSVLNDRDEEFLRSNQRKRVKFGQLEGSQSPFAQGQLFSVNSQDLKWDKDYTLKNQLYQNFTYYNKDVLEFDSFCGRPKSSRVVIDLNNPQIFYEKVHGVLSQQFIKKAKKNKKQVTQSEQETKQQNQGIKQDKDRMKQLRIMAVKQGLDPQTIYMMSRQKHHENSETNEEQTEVQKSLTNMIENHKKMQRQTVVSHSRLANQFIFNDFEVEHINHKNFHRHDFDPVIRKVPA